MQQQSWFNSFIALSANMVTVYVAVRFWHQRSSALRLDPPSCLASIASGSAVNDVFAANNVETPAVAAVTFSELLSLLNSKTSNCNCRQLSCQSHCIFSAALINVEIPNKQLGHNAGDVWRKKFRIDNKVRCVGAHPLSLIHIWRCRRIERCRSRWSPYH